MRSPIRLVGENRVQFCKPAFALFAWLYGGSTHATPLLGDTAAAYNSPETLTDNPATAAFLPNSCFGYSSELIKSESITARYPGLEPVVINHNSPSIPVESRPGAVSKITPNLGIGGFAMPPVPLTFQAKTEPLPITILNSRINVTAKIKAQELGAGSLVVGYRFNNNFGLGLSGEFVAAKFSAQIFSDGSEALATVSGTAKVANLNFGARLELFNGRVGLGLGVSALKMMQVDFKVDSSLTSGSDSVSEFKNIKKFSSGFIGGRVNLTNRLRLHAEIRHAHADPSQTSISLVTLRKELRDVHDTESLRSGMIFALTERLNWLSGIRYEASSVGRGSTGADPKIGYGTQEFLTSVAGAGPLTPYYMVSSGPQIWLSTVPTRGPGSGHSGCHLSTEGGVSFTEASIGINNTGETPGAYYYRKIGVIGGLRYDW